MDLEGGVNVGQGATNDLWRVFQLEEGKAWKPYNSPIVPDRGSWSNVWSR